MLLNIPRLVTAYYTEVEGTNMENKINLSNLGAVLSVRGIVVDIQFDASACVWRLVRS